MQEIRSNPNVASKSKEFSGETTGQSTILVVEDNQHIAGLLEEALTAYGGYQVLVANDVLDAIEIVQSTAGDIDAILLDVKLPDVNGFQFYDFLKENETTADIPTILIPATNYKEEFARRGVKHVLLKPFAMEDLLNCVAEVLSEAA